MESTPPALLKQYQWKNRLLLLFASREEDKAYKLQQAELQKHAQGLEERDLLLIRIFADRVVLPDGSALEPAAAQDLRQYYKLAHQQTAIVLIGKDGGEKLRSGDGLTAERIFQTIDAMPMRRQEMRKQE